MSYNPDAVPRVPDELLSSTMPDWMMRIWLAVRKVQGSNTWAWAAQKHYAEMTGKGKGQVSRGIAALIEAGWLEAGEGRQLRCHVGEASTANPFAKPEKVAQDATNPTEEVEQDATAVAQDATEVEQDATPYNPVIESDQESGHAGASAPATDPDSFDPLGFDAFWNLYGHKTGSRSKTKRKWERLSRKKRAAIMDHVPRFVAAHPDRQYRPYPITYLNQERWLDEDLPERGTSIPDPTAVLTAKERDTLCAAYPLSASDFYAAGRDPKTGLDTFRLFPEKRAEVIHA